MVDKSSQTTRIKNPQQHAHPDYPRFHVPAEKEKSSDCSLSKHFICSKCCLALLEISCQSNVSLHVCPKSISSFESYIHNSRQRNSILLEVLEHMGLDRILGIRGLSIDSISSFSFTIFFARWHYSILSEVLERVGLAGILGIMGALYRQPARITYAGLRSAWCNGREIRQTFGTFLSKIWQHLG